MTTLWRCRDHQRVPRQPGQQEVATISTWRESGTNGTEEWCAQELRTQHPRTEGTAKVTPNPSLFLPCCLILVTLIEANWQGHLKDIGQWGWSQKEWISDWIIKKKYPDYEDRVVFFFFMTNVGPGEMFQQLWTFAAFVEDIGSVSSSHQVTHNHPELSFQWTWYPILTFTLGACAKMNERHLHA